MNSRHEAQCWHSIRSKVPIRCFVGMSKKQQEGVLHDVLGKVFRTWSGEQHRWDKTQPACSPDSTRVSPLPRLTIVGPSTESPPSRSCCDCGILILIDDATHFAPLCSSGPEAAPQLATRTKEFAHSSGGVKRRGRTGALARSRPTAHDPRPKQASQGRAGLPGRAAAPRKADQR